jgi:hypothetical protein
LDASFPLTALIAVISAESCPLTKKLSLELFVDYSGKNSALKAAMLPSNMTVHISIENSPLK